MIVTLISVVADIIIAENITDCIQNTYYILFHSTNCILLNLNHFITLYRNHWKCLKMLAALVMKENIR